MRCIKGFITGIACAFGLVVVLMGGFVLADGVCTEAGGCGGSIFGGSSGTTGWPGSSVIKIITWANSLANAVQIGDGTTAMCHYTDATLGPTIRPCTASNTSTLVLTNFIWSLWDEEGAAAIETVDPDAASTLAMWTYGTAYRPKHSVWFGAGALSTDGTQCAAPAEVTINSGAKLWTIICVDNDAGRMHASIEMPDNWDGGTVTLMSSAIQTAASAGVIEYQASAQCKGDTEALVAAASYGTEVVWTDTLTGSNAVNKATSGAITPSGTCAAGDFLALIIDIGATNTTTAMATLHTLGFKMEYSVTSRSQ